MENGAIPERFGDYLTLHDEQGTPVVLGSGGFGTTICAYRSRWIDGKEIRDDLAVKILRVQAIEEPTRRRAFVDEINALRDLQHPNLVRYMDCGMQDGSIFMVMDLCRGGDLEKLATTLGPFTERAALLSILQVSAGLEEAHRQSYIHRDLKPRNILLDKPVPPEANMVWLEDGLASSRLRLKVVDFGLAGRLEGGLRHTGYSPMFASPEQIRRVRDLDFRTDIYSLGMTLWFLVTARGPLLRTDGQAIDDAKEATRVHNSPIPHDLAFPAALSPEFRQLLSRMVKKSREERFHTIEELIQAIRLVLDRVPARTAGGDIVSNSTTPADRMPLIDLTRQEDWATGKFGDFYSILGEVGRRPIGKLYRSSLQRKIENQFVHVPEQAEVRLTAWISERSPQSESELELAVHLSRLWSVTWSSLAPASLARILEVRRTAAEWFVCEEWLGGSPLEAVVAARGRSLSMEEVAALLMPAAEAADFLRLNEFESALLTVDDIRVFNYDEQVQGDDWLKRPVDTWGNWGMQISPLTAPAAMVGTIFEMVRPSSTGSSGFGVDASQISLCKSFARLLYRIIEGSEAAEAVDWDGNAYENAAKLSGASNVLLRDCICGAREENSMVDVLRRICKNEGVYRIPPRSTGAPVRGHSTGVYDSRVQRSAGASGTASDPSSSAAVNTVLVTDEPEEEAPSAPAPAAAAPPPPTAPVAPPPPVAPPAPVAPPPPAAPPPAAPPARPEVSASASAGSSASMSHTGTPAQPIEVAQLGDGPRMVRSPYGGFHEQQVSGPNWRSSARIHCEETGRVFQLPRRLPPLEALIIPGRFDAVLTPYEDPPAEIAVPLGQWKPNAEITCAYSGMKVRLPHELPVPEGVLLPDRPGVVSSPYGAGPEFELAVEAALWQPGQSLRCPVTGGEFVLPAELSALPAQPTETEGCFTSPYAPEKRFEVPPPYCVPGFAFACPTTDRPLVVPAALPPAWKFEGQVRQGAAPEALSPFVDEAAEAWQPLTPQQWKPRGAVKCRGTGREFVLPKELPRLSVRPAEKSPGVHSPFPPHDVIPIVPAHWSPRAEFTLRFSGGFDCAVVLDADTVAPLNAIPVGDTPGAFLSPYNPAGRITLPSHQCIPGAAVDCPKTNRLMLIPKTFPEQWRWEAEVRQGDVPEARSPFVLEESQAWQPVAAADWRPGQAIRCRATARAFVLRAPLPVLEAAAARKPPAILSPFAPHAPIPIPANSWRRSAEVTVVLPEGPECTVRLPADILPTGRVPVSELAPLPQGTQPHARPRGGEIRSPYDDHPVVEVLAKDWLPGNRLLCPSTEKPFWLPKDLPPLEAPPGSKLGTVWSPYSGKVVEIPPLQWQEGETYECPDTQADFVLPRNLPLLEGRIDPDRAGVVESPFDPGKFFNVDHRHWVAGEVLACPRTRRKFALPADLPEWIAEAEVVGAAHGMVRSPHGSKMAFPVKGEEWVPGNVITCPATNERIRLPAQLPPMEASPIHGKPGLVTSPYVAGGREQRIPPKQWQPGKVLPCATTGRAMRLPEALPPLPKKELPIPMPLAAGGAFLLLLVVAGIWFAVSQRKPAGGGGQQGTPLVADWPRKFLFPAGISPAPPEATVRLVSPKGAADLPVQNENGTLAASLEEALQKPPFQDAASLEIQVTAPGYLPQSVPVKKLVGGIGAAQGMLILSRESGGVVLRGTPPPYYTHVRYKEENGAVEEIPIGKPQQLTTGTYRISLITKDQRIDEKELAAAQRIDSKNPITLDFPPFNFPRTLGGLVRSDNKFLTQVFKVKDDPARAPTMSAERFTLKLWSPVLLIFDEQFLSGHLYELNMPAVVDLVSALDNICYVTIFRASDTEKRPFERASNYQAVFKLADEFHTAVEQPLETATQQQRARIRELASAIRGLLPADIRTLYPKDAARTAAIAKWVGYTELFVQLLNAENDAKWAALVKTCRDGAPLPADALKALAAPLLDRPGILLDSPFTVQAYDGGKSLGIFFSNYQVVGRPEKWGPRLDFLDAKGPLNWRLSDKHAPGGETTFELRKVQ